MTELQRLPSINEKRRIDEVVKMSDSDQIKLENWKIKKQFAKLQKLVGFSLLKLIH